MLNQQTILHSQAPGSKRSLFQTQAESSCISRTYLVQVLSPLQETRIEMFNEPNHDISVHDPCFRSSTILADTGIIFFSRSRLLGSSEAGKVGQWHISMFTTHPRKFCSTASLLPEVHEYQDAHF